MEGMEQGGSVFGGIIAIIILIIFVVAWWKIFTKAGQPGWASIIPIYNIYILLKIAEKPGWWIILMFIPFVNLVVYILTTVAVAHNFGQSTGFAVGLILLPFIFYLILAFSDASYSPVS